MNLVSKFFDELTCQELYKILQIRAEIFVVEQNCAYQDLDGKDFEALHIFLEEKGKIIAYLRSYMKNADVAHMGRVLSCEHGKGFGAVILKNGIEKIREKQNPKQIYIEAQTYALGYYEKVGFVVCSDEFLEDNIPHRQMILSF